MTTGRDVLSKKEAELRAVQIGDVSYHLSLDLVAGAPTYRGDATIRFSTTGGDTFVEFVGERIDLFEVNGAASAPNWDGARIHLRGDDLAADNELRVVYENEYDHTGEGFHQFVDPEDGAEYLYSGFEPYQAHRMFPCFDQPDIKAQFELTVTAPEEWQVVSAGAQLDAEPAGEGRSRRRYAPTLPFSTYIFSVIAGPYRSVHTEHDGVALGLYCRASLFEYLDDAAIFDVTKRGLDFFGEYFGHPYPFGKYDQLFVPEFNWGGMENVGAVTYVESLIFRDPPTAPQLTRRAEILLHELAHMWFGNLVTMRWWDDLWLNESFATYIAYVAMDRATDFDRVWQDFNTRVKVVGYRDDQLPTTHPIADDVPTTDDTFLNFDQITYGKGASTLRQLEATIGPDRVRDGLRTYIDRHRLGNATLPQFLAALQEGSGRDLIRWASRWLRTPSLNTLHASWDEVDGRINRLRLRQTAPEDHPTLRPHRVDVAVVTDTGDELAVATLPATIEGVEAIVPEASGLPAPAMVFPNHNDLGYCLVALDPRSLEFVRGNLPRIEDPLLRQQLWASLWEMVRQRRISSLDFLDLVERHAAHERDAQILRIVTARAVEAVHAYVPEELIDGRAARLAALSREAIDAAAPGDARVLWAEALIGAAQDRQSLLMAGRIVDEIEGIEGLRISQEMRWSVAIRWAAHGMDGVAARLAAEFERDSSDRGRRAMLRAETSAPDAAVKAEAWDRINRWDYGSLHMNVSAMAGFGWRKQRELLTPYAERYFDRLGDVFAEWEFEQARSFFHGLHPGYAVDDETLERSRTTLAAVTDPRLRRLLRESIDRLERAVACRALAAGAAAEDEPGVPPPAGDAPAEPGAAL